MTPLSNGGSKKIWLYLKFFRIVNVGEILTYSTKEKSKLFSSIETLLFSLYDHRSWLNISHWSCEVVSEITGLCLHVEWARIVMLKSLFVCSENYNIIIYMVLMLNIELRWSKNMENWARRGLVPNLRDSTRWLGYCLRQLIGMWLVHMNVDHNVRTQVTHNKPTYYRMTKV